MPDAPTNVYDDVPYPLLSYTQTHPDRLAVIGTLLGMQPAPVEACRVLELGCAVGGNLLPMAQGLPGSQFVGVDYAERQIERAQANAAATGLDNVSFITADIAALPADLGEFDYIVAHGIYSWVPAAVRDALLEACRGHLAPNGIAYVSYNTYPGWHLLRMVREIMLYRTRNVRDPRERVERAREVVRLLNDALEGEPSAYSTFLANYAQQVMPKEVGGPEHSDALLLHDELEATNEPVYFHEFVDHAGSHGLAYLCEAHLANVLPSRLPPRATEVLRTLATNAVEVEQYMDFLKNRSFRETLLCHEGVAVHRRIRADAVREMYVSSRAWPESDSPDLEGEGTEGFDALDNARFVTNHPLTKAALVHLHDVSPQPVAFADLVEATSDRIGFDADAQQATLAENLLRAYGYSEHLIELHPRALGLVLEPGERPLASSYARWQAETGERVTNLRHERVTLDETARWLLRQLDGSRDRTTLVGLLGGARNRGEIVATEGTEATVDVVLRFLGRAALLAR